MDRCSVGPGHSVEAWQRQHQSAQRLSKVLLGDKRTALSVYRMVFYFINTCMCIYILIVFTVLCKKVQENIFFKRTRFDDTSTLVVLIIKIKIEMNT